MKELGSFAPAMRFDRNTLSSEIELKAHVLEQLRASGDINSRTIVANELAVGTRLRRVDLVTLNDCVTAYEIKSAADNLSRLNGQAEMFSLVFDRLVVIAASCHTPRLRKLAPVQAELWEVKPSGVMRQVRRARRKSMASADSLVAIMPEQRLKRVARRMGLRRPASTAELRIRCADASIALLREEFWAHLRRAHAATSDAFWKAVGTGPIEADHLKLLSRYAGKKARADELKYRTEQFWAEWRARAPIALRAIAERSSAL